MEFEVTIPAGEYDGEEYPEANYKIRVFKHNDTPPDGRGFYAPWKAEAAEDGILAHALTTYAFTAEEAAASIRRMLLGAGAE
jgi:hypothetical protein